MKDQKGNIGVVVSFIIVVCLIGLVIYSLMNKPEKENPLEGITTGEIKDNAELNSAATKQEESAPSQKTMETVSKNGDVLVMNYTGRFTNGKTFDSNVDPAFGHVKPFEFTLGAGMVIKGWDEGLVGMKIGEKKVLTVSPEKGYGPNDYNGIPGGSTLIFDVELVGIK